MSLNEDLDIIQGFSLKCGWNAIDKDTTEVNKDLQNELISSGMREEALNIKHLLICDYESSAQVLGPEDDEYETYLKVLFVIFRIVKPTSIHPYLTLLYSMIDEKFSIVEHTVSGGSVYIHPSQEGGVYSVYDIRRITEMYDVYTKKWTRR